VIVSAPSVARFTAPAAPDKHRHAARLLGAEPVDAPDAGEALASAMTRLMRATAMPSGLSALGYATSDVPSLVAGAFAQQRLLANAPLPVSEEDLAGLFGRSFAYW
jgi:alcohol dehydrogenase class IV